MKKKRTALVALLLAVLLLSGCTAPGELASDVLRFFRTLGSEPPSPIQAVPLVEDGDMPPFDEIEYVRPDVLALRMKVAGLRLALANGESLRGVMELLDLCFDDYFHFETMSNIAYIRSCQDVTDPFYAEEYTWCDEQNALVSQTMEELYYACGSSRLADRLEKRYFWEGFAEEYADDSGALYDEELVGLLRRESALLARYRSLAAEAASDGVLGETNWFGGAYQSALDRHYQRYNEQFAEIYIELVKVRRSMAEKLGYDSYEEMAYDYSYARDFDPEQAAAYVADIKRYIVPLYRDLSADALSEVDYPYLSTERLYAALEYGTKQMGGSVEEAYRYMSDYRLYDIRVSAEKAATSFQIYLDEYEVPFLFLDAAGDLKDVLDFSHEFGHYLDAFVNYNASETLDVSETFSQAMEYLILGYLDGALEERELEELYRIKMLDTLELYVQQASFDEFERIVYATDPDKLDVDFLNELSLRMAEEYGYYDGVSRTYYAMSWSDISHFFDSPFYIITYPVSNDIAMQIYELERQNPGTGLEKYLEILPREYSGFLDTVTEGGLESPFAPGRIERVAGDLYERLSAPAAAA